MATLQSQTYDGIPAGMNVAQPSFGLDDTEARYLQDVLLDYPGLVRRRGAVKAASGFATFAKKGCGIVGTITPAGTYRVGVFVGDNSTGEFQMLSDDFTTSTAFTWGMALPAAPPSNPYSIVDTKPSLMGGALMGTSSNYNSASPLQHLAFWRGGNKADYTTGQATLVRGSATVTGSGTTWTSNVSPGMFLFSTIVDATNTGRFNLTYVGVVKSVESNTSLTLMENSPYSTTTTGYKFTSVRGFQYRVVKGRITTTTSATTVTGANTKFISQFMDETLFSGIAGTTTNASAIITGISSTTGLASGMRVTGTSIPAGSFILTVDSGTQITINQNCTASGATTMTFKHAWNIYRASDFEWIGRVTLVNNEISITLAANATLSLNNERFIALCGTGNWDTNTMASQRKVGFLTAFYAGRQWYANNGQRLDKTSRVWFSDTSDPEGVDLANFDGDFFDISSSVGSDTPIKAITPAYNSLVVTKENETYAITGSSPTTFSVKKIQDDGCLSGMSVVPYGGGVLWAGVDGIYFYDGINVSNLASEKLGDYYKNAVRDVDPSTHRMWAMIVRGHYMLFIESFDPNIPVVKGTLSYSPSAVTIVINLETRAFKMFTNVATRGAIETPSDTGKQVLYVVNDGTKANICQGFDLFDAEENDSILCDLGAASGVHRYGETAPGAATTFNGVADTKYFSKITVATRAALTSIRVYSVGQGGGSGACNVRAGIYTDVAGVPTALLGSSAVVALNQADGPAFRDYDFATPLELASGDYWIGVQVETSGRVAFYQKATVDSINERSDTYSDGLSDPFGAVSTANGPLIAHAFVLTAGPDFYIESKKYSQGDSMWKKMFKQLMLNYIVQGDSLRIDTVVGLQEIGRTATSAYPVTVYSFDQLAALVQTWDQLAELFPTWDTMVAANFRPKRIKFIKRTQLMSFRLWQNSPAVTRAQLGPFQIAFKWMRLGRV